MLRVTDVLMNNLLEDVLERDKTVDVGKAKSQKPGVHLDKKQILNSIGIIFNIVTG